MTQVEHHVSDTTLLAGGGEYPNQDGFGWTNVIVISLIQGGGEVLEALTTNIPISSHAESCTPPRFSIPSLSQKSSQRHVITSGSEVIPNRWHLDCRSLYSHRSYTIAITRGGTRSKRIEVISSF